MTTKKEPNHSEIDVIMQAYADTMDKIAEVAGALAEKYDGMTQSVALEAAKDYFTFGVLPMELNPENRKIAEDKVKKYNKERAARLKKLEEGKK